MMDWQETDKGLYKKYTFKDFAEAFRFMERVAKLAQAANHHPTWTNNWNTVEIWLITHSSGNQITEADRTLAADIDRVTGV
jgi:4a-hydroxytetrahydrobiopterin dehydratase